MMQAYFLATGGPYKYNFIIIYTTCIFNEDFINLIILSYQVVIISMINY